MRYYYTICTSLYFGFSQKMARICNPNWTKRLIPSSILSNYWTHSHHKTDIAECGDYTRSVNNALCGNCHILYRGLVRFTANKYYLQLTGVKESKCALKF